MFEILDRKIELICEDVGATQPPTLFITNSEWLNNELNRRRRFRGEPEEEYKPLFRYDVAVTQPYKGNRKNPKPFHFNNLIVYMLAEYDTVVAQGGYEADDLMVMAQAEQWYNTQNGTWDQVPYIICSRDKDLRICPGYHFSWECGKQKAIGPEYTDELGRLILDVKEKDNGKVDKKVYGYGLKFFYFQMLVGDTADYIPGLPKWGQIKAYNLINELETHEEVFKAVKAAYIETMGLCEAKDYWMEQANLLWMVQKEGESYTIPKF